MRRFLAVVLSLSLLFQNIVVVMPVAAQVTASPSAPSGQRPLVDGTANGVPLVNIAPPSAGGVSHNQYNQFNVDQRGLILNNSMKPSQTTLGGWVGGNAQLQHTGAGDPERGCRRQCFTVTGLSGDCRAESGTGGGESEWDSL